MQQVCFCPETRDYSPEIRDRRPGHRVLDTTDPVISTPVADAAYICRGDACSLSITDAKRLSAARNDLDLCLGISRRRHRLHRRLPEGGRRTRPDGRRSRRGKTVSVLLHRVISRALHRGGPCRFRHADRGRDGVSDPRSIPGTIHTGDRSGAGQLPEPAGPGSPAIEISSRRQCRKQRARDDDRPGLGDHVARAGPAGPGPDSSLRIRYSSNRRIRRCSWSGAACRAGTRPRRPCPSD